MTTQPPAEPQKKTSIAAWAVLGLSLFIGGIYALDALTGGTSSASNIAGRDFVRIQRADFSAAWPLTVDVVTLRCVADGTKRYVTAEIGDGVVYGLNGTSTTHGFVDSSHLRRRTEPIAVTAYDKRPEQERKTIFARVVACEDAGQEGCSAKIGATARLSSSAIKLITNEGVARSWPPLPAPPFIPLEPLIARGLGLCH